MHLVQRQLKLIIRRESNTNLTEMDPNVVHCTRSFLVATCRNYDTFVLLSRLPEGWTSRTVGVCWEEIQYLRLFSPAYIIGNCINSRSYLTQNRVTV
jgi:hypothetical protein